MLLSRRTHPFRCLWTSLLVMALIAPLSACGDDDAFNDDPQDNKQNRNGPPISDEADEELTAAVEEFLTEHFADRAKSPCFAVAQIDGEEIRKAVGCAEPDNPRDIDFDSRFQIGSITKTMLGIVTRGYLADQGLEITIPVEELLPTGVEVPRNDGEEILVAHLLTHTSGFPVFPTEVIPFSDDEDNPYKDISAQDILDSLSHPSLDFPNPMGVWDYSNYGTMLLTVALVEHSGRDFDDLLEEYVLEPAGMDDSGLHASTVQGHNDEGPAPTWDLHTNIAGVGGLRASLNDMIAYAQLNLADGDETHLEPVRAAQESIAQWPDGEFEYGSLWFIFEAEDHPDLRLLFHGGRTATFNTSMFLEKGGDRATIVLADTDDAHDELVEYVSGFAAMLFEEML